MDDRHGCGEYETVDEVRVPSHLRRKHYESIFIYKPHFTYDNQGYNSNRKAIYKRIICPIRADDMAISVSEMSVYPRIYDTTVSGMVNISKDISNGWSVKATMQKCKDIRNLDTCDYLKSFSLIKRGCDSEPDSSELELYTLFFRYTQPRLSCPIKSGIYTVLAYPFLIEDNYLTVSESKISTNIFGYTFRLEGFQIQKLFCMEAHLQLIYVRENNWLNETVAGEDDDSDEY